MVVVELALIALTTFLGLIAYQKWSLTYWKRRNLPYLEPKLFLGNLENPVRRNHSLGVWIKVLYDQAKSKGYDHAGFYFLSTPAYIATSLEILKHILQKDFQHFVDRGSYYNERDDPLSAHLFAIGGQKWRNLRTKLTPTFSSGKMKMMFDTFVKCGAAMEEAVREMGRKRTPVEIKDVLARFTTDVIGSCAFGVDCNSFKNPDAEFRKYGKLIFDSQNKLHAIKIAIGFSNENLARKLRITTHNQEATEFFMKVVKDTVQFRKENKIVHKDMLQILMELQDDEASRGDGKALTIEEIAAQAFVFFMAGFETSSTTMTFCLYELGLNPTIQQRVRDEIEAVLSKHQGQITYDSIMEMQYMDQVIKETLRKYPAVPFINRIAGTNYQVPDTDFLIEKGTRVYVSIFGLHRDPEHFPQPDLFDPERFSSENKKLIRPFSYIPFGEGPRLCIGMRFGMTQMKVGLTILLKNFQFSVNDKLTKVPLEMDRYSFVLSGEGGIWLDVKEVKRTI